MLQELTQALRTRKVSAAELVAQAIERIETLDTALNAVVVRNFAGAREAAKAADAALARGEQQPLLGIPMLWVGGGILLHGLAEFGIAGPEHLIETAAEAIGDFAPVGGAVLSWLVTAAAAGVIGLAAGALTQIVVSLSTALFRRR